jgi:WD40 repeat protein
VYLLVNVFCFFFHLSFSIYIYIYFKYEKEVLRKQMCTFIYATLTLNAYSYVDSYDSIDVIDNSTKTKVKNFPVGSKVRCISLSRDKASLLVGCHDGTTKVMDIITGQILHVYRGHTGVVSCIIAGSGNDIITCSEDKSIKRWSFEGVCVTTYLGHSNEVNSVLFSAKRNRIYSAGYDNFISVWDYDSGVEVGKMLGHEGDVTSLAWVKGEETFVSGSRDNSVRLWDTTEMVLMRVIGSHADYVWSVSASSDGRFVVSSGCDSKVNIWDVEKSQLVGSLAPHGYWLLPVSISPNGAFIASGDYHFIFNIHKIDPPLYSIIHEGNLSRLIPTSIHESKNFCISSDGIIRDSDTFTIVATITSSTTCSMISDSTTFTITSNNNNNNNNNNNKTTHIKKIKYTIEDEALEFAAPTTESAQLWVEAISAVRHNLSLDPLQRAVSAEKMIERYRYDLLQVIIQCTGPFELRFPKILREYIGNYLILGELKNNI